MYGRRKDVVAASGAPLTVEQEMALVLGPIGRGFKTEAAARRAWALHGPRLMAKPRNPGTRPHGWWIFTPGAPPLAKHNYSINARRLYEGGFCSPAEAAALEACWKRTGRPPADHEDVDPRIALFAGASRVWA